MTNCYCGAKGNHVLLMASTNRRFALLGPTFERKQSKRIGNHDQRRALMEQHSRPDIESKDRGGNQDGNDAQADPQVLPDDTTG